MSKLPDERINPANLWGKPMPTMSPRSASSRSVIETRSDKRRSADSELDDISGPDDEELAAEEEEETDDHDVMETDDYSSRTKISAVDDDPDDVDDEEQADDESDIAPEDDDDNVDLLSDNSSSTVADEINDDDDANEGISTMAEKKSGADHIRDEIKKRRASGESLRGVDIVAALAKRKIVVAAAQVSQLLKAAGVTTGRTGRPAAEKADDAAKSRVAAKGKKPASVAAAPAGRIASKVAPRASASAPNLPMAQLEAASVFLEACDGCYDTAAEILAAHNRLGKFFTSDNA